MKKFHVYFIDAGQCDIFDVAVDAYGYRSAIKQAIEAYKAAGHKREHIKEIRAIYED
jgi:hypothetical protein